MYKLTTDVLLEFIDHVAQVYGVDILCNCPIDALASHYLTNIKIKASLFITDEIPFIQIHHGFSGDFNIYVIVERLMTYYTFTIHTDNLYQINVSMYDKRDKSLDEVKETFKYGS